MIPPGLAIQNVEIDGDAVLVVARSVATTSPCPGCGSLSRRVHSRYIRRVADLPCAGHGIRLRLIARRFPCGDEACQQSFAERVGAGVLAERARRTGRLNGIVHHLGLALGGRPGASLARRLMLPVSNDTLLRLVRRRARHPSDPLRVVGVDDWAFRRNQRYGSIICDLERRREVSFICGLVDSTLCSV